jgi:small GTP-binding protein
MTDVVKKVCMCGDPSVGKTSLVRRFILGKYDEKYKSTLGTVVSKKTVKAPKNHNKVTMMIWDISGQPEFKRIHASAFKNSGGGLAVCDVTRPDTCDHLQGWISSFREHAGSDTPVVVLANKSDLADEDSGVAASFFKMCDEQNIPILSTSAKTGENVEEAFKLLANVVSADGTGGHMTETSDAIEMPERLFSAGELLDYMTVRFCDAFGDDEMGMHMVRKQVKDRRINFQSVTKKEAVGLIEAFVSIIAEFKGETEARKLRMDLNQARERCIGC